MVVDRAADQVNQPKSVTQTFGGAEERWRLLLMVKQNPPGIAREDKRIAHIQQLGRFEHNAMQRAIGERPQVNRAVERNVANKVEHVARFAGQILQHKRLFEVAGRAQNGGLFSGSAEAGKSGQFCQDFVIFEQYEALWIHS